MMQFHSDSSAIIEIVRSEENLFENMKAIHRAHGIKPDRYFNKVVGYHWEVDRRTRQLLDLECLRDRNIFSIILLEGNDGFKYTFEGVEIVCRDMETVSASN